MTLIYNPCKLNRKKDTWMVAAVFAMRNDGNCANLSHLDLY